MRGIFILNEYGRKMKHIIWSERCLVDIFYLPVSNGGEPGSSVSIVSGYVLDDRSNEVRSPA
jgi:hypothetical protein